MIRNVVDFAVGALRAHLEVNLMQSGKYLVKDDGLRVAVKAEDDRSGVDVLLLDDRARVCTAA
jgi:hypothetical protein